MEFKEPNIVKFSYMDPCKTQKLQYKYFTGSYYFYYFTNYTMV